MKIENVNKKTPNNEPWSAISHLVGACFSLAALIILVVKSRNYASPLHTISFLIYGISQFLLYTMSTLYHSFNRGTTAKKLFRRFDHITIFWFIAGTYTPVCLVVLDKPLGWFLVVSIWIIAFLGTIFKAIWIKSPGWLNSTLYIIMGWLAVYVLRPLHQNIGFQGVALIILGGLLYSIGAIIYAISKKQDLKRSIKVHDLFHWFVLAGSLSFFWVMYFIVLPYNPS